MWRRRWEEWSHKVKVDIDVPQNENKHQLLVDSDEVEVVSVYATIANVDGDVKSHDD